MEEPSALEKSISPGWASDFRYSLGFTLAANGRIGGVVWGSPAFEQGLGVGWDLIAVNDRGPSAEALRAAITGAKSGGPLTLVVRNGDRVRTLNFDWREGLRHPRLERVTGTPDRLGDILAARRP